MNSTGLYDHFRSQVFDVAEPRLWSDDEIWLYAGDAHRQFVRLTGGIADFTSDATRVTVTTGEDQAPLDPSLLRIMTAYRVSDKAPVQVINQTDELTRNIVINLNDPQPGPVQYLLVGRQKHVAQWVCLPVEDDEVQLSVYRLPLSVINGDGQTITDVDEEHHIHLIAWMKHLAYMKHDAEAMDLQKANEYGNQFREYCAQVKLEWERMKHKPRAVRYGGL